MTLARFSERSALHATLWLFRRELYVCLIFTLVINLLMLTPTLYMLQVTDRVFASRSELTLLALTLFMLLLFLVMTFAEWSRARLLVRTGVKLDLQLDSRVFNASFESYLGQVGVHPTQPFSDLTQIRQFLTGTGLFALLDVPWTPIYLSVLFLLHPVLGWLSIVFILLSLGVAGLSHRLTQRPSDRAQQAGLAVQAFVQSKLKNSEVIEAMGMLGDLRRRWHSHQQHYLQRERQVQDVAQRLQSLSKFLRYTQNSMTLAVGALLVIRGELSLGGIVAANMLMSRATQPVDLMVSQWKYLLSARRSFRRLEALLTRHPQRVTGQPQAIPRGFLRIENLLATAPAGGQVILRGLNAEFPAGETVAIIGPSGSGKSTLARALVGVWPDVSGQVLLDGVPMKSWDREQLGPFLGYLPQSIEFFEGSIAENISRFGDINAQTVIAACQRAGVHEMILRLPRGYDTAMGEAGSLLSGGQRQRIGLARALYGDPSLIVLDEPNSHLDEVGDAALARALQELKQAGKTIILVTHRIGVLALADRILELRDGAIALYGPAQDVLAAMRARDSGAKRNTVHAMPQAQPA
jgi:ATP-binding cassette subfamily C exporter for protease/lipase